MSARCSAERLLGRFFVTGMVVLVTACSAATISEEPTEEKRGPGGGTSPSDDTSAAPDDSGTTKDTAGENDSGSFYGVVDCADLPEMGNVREVDGARGYHDVAFDSDGNILGSDNSSLKKTTYEGDSSVWVPNMGYVEQMDWLPDGDLVVSEGTTGQLVRVSPEGARSTLTSDLWAYEVMVAPDGNIYTANNGSVVRVDPETGDKEVLLPGVSGGARVLAFDLDYSRMFIGTLSGIRLYVVDVDENLEPSGKVEVFGVGPGKSYHDGLALDVCGNIYVAVYADRSLYRVTPDGEVSLYWDASPSNYGHGLKWGTGSSGWREDALYMPLPYGNNKVIEVVIGVPGREWEGEVVNAKR